MTTAFIPNNYLKKAMQRSIRGLEKNGYTARRILPVDPMAGIHAREFRADFAKHPPPDCWYSASESTPTTTSPTKTKHESHDSQPSP